MNRKIKILYVLPLGSIGGAEKFVLSLCHTHDKSQFEIAVCVLFSGTSVAEEIAASGYEVIRLNMKNGFDLLRAVRLITLIRKRKFDIVNIHGQNPLGKLCSLLGFAPLTIHTDHGTTIGSPVKRRKRVVFFNHLLNPFFDYFIAISKGMEKSLRLREKVPSIKISLIYNGVDVESITRTPCSPEKLKKSLGIAPYIPVLGTIGRLAPEKQYPFLFNSLLYLRDKGLDFVVIIIGDGPDRQSLETLVREMNLADRIQFLGERNDIVNLLDIMDIFVFSSGGEAFSITILEAMAKAKPIVAFDVEGVNEAVVSNQTGFLVPFGNTEEFALKMESILKSPDLARRLGTAGLRRVTSLFNLKENVRKTEILYNTLLNNRGSSGTFRCRS